MNRLTENDKTYRRLTWGKSNSNLTGLYYTSGYDGDDDDEPSAQRNKLYLHFAGYSARLVLPFWLKPLKTKVKQRVWYEGLVDEGNKSYHIAHVERRYGFVSTEETAHLFYGLQPSNRVLDNTKIKSASCIVNLPWKSMRLTADELYDGCEVKRWEKDFRASGFTLKERNNQVRELMETRRTMFKQRHLVQDSNGEMVIVKAHYTFMEWERGTGWFRWLSFFTPTMTRRSVELEFEKGVGKDKGQWKGKVTQLSFKMLDNESLGGAVRRYFNEEVSKDPDMRGITYLKPLYPFEKT